MLRWTVWLPRRKISEDQIIIGSASAIPPQVLFSGSGPPERLPALVSARPAAPAAPRSMFTSLISPVPRMADLARPDVQTRGLNGGLNPGSSPSAVPSAYAQIIQARFYDELAAFSGTRGKSEIYASLRAVTEYIANEYGNRFLVELIQNGHDAHVSNDAPGEIRCRFVANEGDYGTLYVANQGHPFGECDFKAICQFARSSKRPGESIGNKGIGFRSVLQICQYPEVYSACAPKAGNRQRRGREVSGSCRRRTNSPDCRTLRLLF